MHSRQIFQNDIVPLKKLHVVQQQVLVRADPCDLFACLTSWNSLPSLLPVSPMLELVAGEAIDMPAVAGDMLVGRGLTGKLEQLFVVTTAVQGLLWSVITQSLSSEKADDQLHLTVAIQPAFNQYSLLVVQIVGGSAELIDDEELSCRLEHIRIKFEMDQDASRPMPHAAMPRVERVLPVQAMAR